MGAGGVASTFADFPADFPADSACLAQIRPLMCDPITEISALVLPPESPRAAPRVAPSSACPGSINKLGKLPRDILPHQFLVGKQNSGVFSFDIFALCGKSPEEEVASRLQRHPRVQGGADQHLDHRVKRLISLQISSCSRPREVQLVSLSHTQTRARAHREQTSQ